MIQISISEHNKKLGPIPSFSLPAGKSCPNSVFCISKCYTLRLEKLRPTVRDAYQRNFDIARDDLPSFVEQMTGYFYWKRPRFFRLHVSGDFFSQEYLTAWLDIARAFPEIKFLAYTKAFDLDYGDLPDNFFLKFSTFPDMPAPMLEQIESSGQSIAAAGESNPKGYFDCENDCSKCQICWTDQDVFFKMH